MIKPVATPRRTIKEFAREYLLRENYVDLDSRKVGYDYAHILAEIKVAFPTSHTSRKELQKIAYAMNAEGCRLPARKRSRTGMARDYARVLAITPEPPLSYKAIVHRVVRKFPGCRDAVPSHRGLLSYAALYRRRK